MAGRCTTRGYFYIIVIIHLVVRVITIIEAEMNRFLTIVRRVRQGTLTFPQLKLTVPDGVQHALSCAPRSILSHKTAPGGGSGGRRTEPSSARSPAMDNPPNNNIHTIVRAQIVFLLSTLTEDNFDRNQAEIRSVCPSNSRVHKFTHFCVLLS